MVTGKLAWCIRYCAAGILMVFFTLLLLLPVYTVIREGLNVSMLLEVFRNPIYVEGLLNSTLIAVTSTAMVFLISLPLAWLYDRFDFPGKFYDLIFIKP